MFDVVSFLIRCCIVSCSVVAFSVFVFVCVCVVVLCRLRFFD